MTAPLNWRLFRIMYTKLNKKNSGFSSHRGIVSDSRCGRSLRGIGWADGGVHHFRDALLEMAPALYKALFMCGEAYAVWSLLLA